jgi:O-antigen/teichoic acid export membrane protein
MDTNKKTKEPNLIADSLQMLTRGTVIVIIGSLISAFLFLFSRLLIARYWTTSDFGIFSIALSIVSLFTIVSILGLERGITRNIAYYKGKKDYEKIPKIIASSIFTTLAASNIIAIILFFSSEAIAEGLFHEPALVAPLQIFSVAIPFFNLISILVSILRGFNQIKPYVYFQQILLYALFFFFLLCLVIFNMSFINIFYAHIGSLILTCVVLAIYIIRKTHGYHVLSNSSITLPITKELLLFSLPLLGTAMIQHIMGWTDTLMLGGIKSAVEVGLYNAARPLSAFITFPLSALLIIYVPVISGLYGRGKIDEIKRNFLIITKWISLITLPLFLILFLYSETIISYLFGAPYVLAANALRVLSLGIFLHSLAGPNGGTLIAMGKTRFILFAFLSTALLNVSLNVFLIPPYGILGAAIASTIAVFATNIIKCQRLYSLNRIKPLGKNLIKPSIASLLIIFLIYIIVNNFYIITFWMVPALFVLFCLITFIAVLFTKSLDEEDVQILVSISRKIGIKSQSIERFLRKFM